MNLSHGQLLTSTEDQLTSIEISQDLLDRLDVYAKQHGRDSVQVIREAIEALAKEILLTEALDQVN